MKEREREKVCELTNWDIDFLYHIYFNGVSAIFIFECGYIFGSVHFHQFRFQIHFDASLLDYFPQGVCIIFRSKYHGQCCIVDDFSVLSFFMLDETKRSYWDRWANRTELPCVNSDRWCNIFSAVHQDTWLAKLEMWKSHCPMKI